MSGTAAGAFTLSISAHPIAFYIQNERIAVITSSPMLCGWWKETFTTARRRIISRALHNLHGWKL